MPDVYNQAMALAAVMASQTVNGDANMGAAVVLAPSRSAGVQVKTDHQKRCKAYCISLLNVLKSQTRERETWRTWVIFLSYVLMSSKGRYLKYSLILLYKAFDFFTMIALQTKQKL